MRNRIQAMVMVLALFAGALDAMAARTPPADVGAGRVAWFDITTTKISLSTEFYGKLFDWTFTALEKTNLAVEIVSRGTPIGTIRAASGKIGTTSGVVYVQVDDILASCAKAKELGGAVVEGFPFNLSDGIGAIALVVDPAGHAVGMYSRTPLPK